MQKHDPIEKSATNAPLHSILWSLGKSWLQGSTAKRETENDAYRPGHDHSDHSLAAKSRSHTVQQLATALRMQGIDEEHDSMLSTLESLALAGEINFTDYVSRVSHLFPRSMDMLDVSLRMKIASLALPS